MPKDPGGDFLWLFGLLSAAMSTLAIVALARHGLVTWSLSAPMALVTEAYAATTRLLFGWTEPYVQGVLTRLGSVIGWRPTLYSHWRDVLVLMGVLAAGYGRSLQLTRTQSAFGFVGVLLGAVASGLLPLLSNNIIVQMAIASVPLAVTTFVTLSLRLANWAQAVAASLAIGGLGAFHVHIAHLAKPPWYFPVNEMLVNHELPGLGLAVLAIGVGLMGAMSLLNVQYNNLSNPRLTFGITILGGYVGAALFFAIDAGLKLLGG